MGELKLPRLRDRTPVKLSITVSPDLMASLSAYAAAYKETYGQEEPISDLVPAMLRSFLESDRGFAKARARLDASGAGL